MPDPRQQPSKPAGVSGNLLRISPGPSSAWWSRNSVAVCREQGLQHLPAGRTVCECVNCCVDDGVGHRDAKPGKCVTDHERVGWDPSLLLTPAGTFQK